MSAAAPEPALVLDHVSAGYGPFRALFEVDLTVGDGEAVALLGANGVGKTTVARVATGLVAPSAGTVVVAGEGGVRTIVLGSGVHGGAASGS